MDDDATQRFDHMDEDTTADLESTLPVGHPPLPPPPFRPGSLGCGRTGFDPDSLESPRNGGCRRRTKTVSGL